MTIKKNESSCVEAIIARIIARDYTIGIVGMGYIGLPLALVALEAGFRVIGFDIDPVRVDFLSRGNGGIKHVPNGPFRAALAEGRVHITDSFTRLSQPDAILITVPTPLSKQREPDLSFVENSARAAAKTLRRGQLIVLESTSWPGTTREIMRPILEATGLNAGEDFFLAYSPEREDPGNSTFSPAIIPKVVGADDPRSLKIACALYKQLAIEMVPVSTTATAEAVKLTENIFRSINIALANELKVIFNKMGIDVWEVIDAAKTKPFGFMPFYPGPGVGGPCVPIDPLYLTWKAHEFDVETRFIELASHINSNMPNYVVDRLAEALDRHQRRGLYGSRVLIIGLSYKSNIEDIRESASLTLIKLIENRGATTDFHDPFVPEIPLTRGHSDLMGRRSIDFTPQTLADYDAIVIATDHDAVDWATIAAHGQLVIDTRNICARNGWHGPNIVRA